MDDHAACASHLANRDYLTELWQSQLARSNLRVLDDFFDLGGSSMQAIEMLMTVSSRFGKEIDYAEFFKNPCIRKLAELLEAV
jgi:acyl carrier protein